MLVVLDLGDGPAVSLFRTDIVWTGALSCAWQPVLAHWHEQYRSVAAPDAAFFSVSSPPMGTMSGLAVGVWHVSGWRPLYGRVDRGYQRGAPQGTSSGCCHL